MELYECVEAVLTDERIYDLNLSKIDPIVALRKLKDIDEGTIQTIERIFDRQGQREAVRALIKEVRRKIPTFCSYIIFLQQNFTDLYDEVYMVLQKWPAMIQRIDDERTNNTDPLQCRKKFEFSPGAQSGMEDVKEAPTKSTVYYRHPLQSGDVTVNPSSKHPAMPSSASVRGPECRDQCRAEGGTEFVEPRMVISQFQGHIQGPSGDPPSYTSRPPPYDAASQQMARAEPLLAGRSNQLFSAPPISAQQSSQQPEGSLPLTQMKFATSSKIKKKWKEKLKTDPKYISQCIEHGNLDFTDEQVQSLEAEQDPAGSFFNHLGAMGFTVQDLANLMSDVGQTEELSLLQIQYGTVSPRNSQSEQSAQSQYKTEIEGAHLEMGIQISTRSGAAAPVQTAYTGVPPSTQQQGGPQSESVRFGEQVSPSVDDNLAEKNADLDRLALRYEVDHQPISILHTSIRDIHGNHLHPISRERIGPGVSMSQESLRSLNSSFSAPGSHSLANPNLSAWSPPPRYSMSPAVSMPPAQPPVGMSQAQPAVSMSPPQPPVGMSQAQPPVSMSQAQPAVSMSPPQPEVSMSQAQPPVSMSQAQLPVSMSQAQPAVSMSPPQPAVSMSPAQPPVSMSQEQFGVSMNLESLQSSDRSFSQTGSLSLAHPNLPAGSNPPS